MIQALVSVTFIGYQSLLIILEKENIFSSLCNSNEDIPCQAQELRLDLMYTLAVSSSYISYLLFAIFILKYGPKAGFLIGGIMEVIGCIIFSFGYDWPCFISYIIIGVGSSGIILGVIGIPSQYSIKYQGILYSLLIGAIDASSGITYIFLMCYTYLNISFQALYIILSFAILIITVISYFFVFSKHFTRNTTRYETMDVELDVELPLVTESISSEEMIGTYNIHFNSTWSDTFYSKQFVSILIWSMFYITYIYFYISTLDKHLRWVTNETEDKILFGQIIFSIMLFASGICGIVTGPLIDAFGMKFALFIMAILSLFTSICSMLKIYKIDISATMIGFILNRFFFFTMCPLLIVTIFGNTKQNFIYGLVLFISACFNLLNIFFDYLTQKVLNGNYSIINMILGILCCLSALQLLYQFRRNPLIT